MIDPTTHDVYVVEKKVQTIGVQKQNWVFRLDQPLQNGVINVARKVAITTTAKSYVSADISPSGDIALKAGTVAYIWPRTDADRGGDVRRPPGRTLHGLAAHRVGGHRLGAGRPVDGARRHRSGAGRAARVRSLDG